MSAAVFRQPGIGTGNILVEDPIETAGPGLGDVVLPQPGNQRGRIVSAETTERPAGEVHVRINDHTPCPFALRIGVSSRRRFSPRINRLADSGISAPVTL